MPWKGNVQAKGRTHVLLRCALHQLALITMQVKGRKRLLLYRPQALKALQPYPNWHILRRRCRVDPAHPDYKRFPAFERVHHPPLSLCTAATGSSDYVFAAPPSSVETLKVFECPTTPLAYPLTKHLGSVLQVAALEAVLEPGDSLVFPAKWAHYTQSLDNCISVTYRLGPKRPPTAMLARSSKSYRACHSTVKCLLV